MIELSHVYKTYPGPMHALRDLSLQVARGEMAFLTGPSGAGKTSLFRLISAFDRPTSGRLIVNGFELSAIGERAGATIAQYRQTLGVVFQDFRLLSDRSVFDNIALPLQIRGLRGQQVGRMVHDVAEAVGLGARLEHLPLQLSGGEQQRVSIARALIHRPDLVIADEPTGNLDPDMSTEIMSLFERVHRRGATVLIATHDLDRVRRLGYREIRLKAGQLVDTKASPILHPPEVRA